MACRRAAGPRSWSSSDNLVTLILQPPERTIMPFDFTGKRVIVAGGSRGIGRSIALGFAAAGAGVSICARGAEALAAARRELDELGGVAHAATCDLADGAAITRYI